jgi:quercetin dioxygenase-like cupin family protein
MDIRPCGSQASRRASADWFTGVVWQDPVIEAPALPAGVRATLVRFDPSARTHWHTHPLGQTLYIVSGIGRVQAWGGNIREVRAGDVVWFPPGEKHWHGAGPSVGMAHLAITEVRDGKFVEWLETVSEEQYKGT